MIIKKIRIPNDVPLNDYLADRDVQIPTSLLQETRLWSDISEIRKESCA